MSRVRIIDSLSHSTFHEMFNATIIYMAGKTFGQVELRCSRSTLENTTKLIKQYKPTNNTSEIKYKKLYVYASDSTVGGFFKYILSGLKNVWQLLICPQKTQLIYLNNNPLSLWFVILLNYIMGRKITIFCHGELDQLVQKPKLYKPSFWYKHIFCLLFKYGRIGKNITMCVLGESILKNLKPHLNKVNLNRVCSMEHPYFFSQNQCSKPTSEIIQIGTVGTMTWAKGLDELLYISNNIDNTKVKLTIVGRIMENVDLGKYPNVKALAGKEGFIPREQYEKAIQELDYILFLYPVDSYKFIASGAVFDALDLCKPIIGLNNDYFENVLKDNVGYLCQTKEEVIKVIQSCANQNRQNYTTFVDNIVRLRENFDADNLVNQFQQVTR